MSDTAEANQAEIATLHTDPAYTDASHPEHASKAAEREEAAAQEQARQERLYELCARRIGAIEDVEKGMRLIAAGLKEAEDYGEKMRQLAPKRLTGPRNKFNHASVADSLNRFGGALGLDRWLTDSQSQYTDPETRSLVEMEEAKHRQFLETPE